MILYTLLYLDNCTLEKIGFRFNPYEFNNNIQKNILWKSWEIEIKNKIQYYIPPKRILTIFNSSPFQNEIKSKVELREIWFTSTQPHFISRLWN